MQGLRGTLVHTSLGVASAVALAMLLSVGSAQADRRHDGYSGATDSYSGATDGYSGATQKNGDWNRHDRKLDREQRRALERFNRQRSRDYRELGQRRFRSDRAHERAYRELDRQHEARLRDILGASRYREERQHYNDYDQRSYDNPEQAVINLILRELLNR